MKTYCYSIKNICLIIMLAQPVASKSMFTSLWRRYSAKIPYALNMIKKALVKKPATIIPAGHIVYNTDGSPVEEALFKDIKENIIDDYEFPKAMYNNKYNPQDNETVVIQKKLDAISKQTAKEKKEKLTVIHQDSSSEFPTQYKDRTTLKTTWIPDTLHDLFRYTANINQWDDKEEHEINNIISNELIKNPQKPNESSAAYFARVGTPLIEHFYEHIADAKNVANPIYTLVPKDKIHEMIKNAIIVEAKQRQEHPETALLYRGGSSYMDFDEKDCYEVASKGVDATFCKIMTGDKTIPSHLDTKEKAIKREPYPIALSFAHKLLNGIKTYWKCECPLNFAIQNKREHNTQPDLYALVVNKQTITDDLREYHKKDSDYKQYKKSLFSVSSEESLDSSCVWDHAYAKAHVDHNYNGPVNGKNRLGSSFPRIQSHQTKQEAYQGIVDLKKYQLDHAIGVTPLAKELIAKGKAAYQAGLESSMAKN